MMPPVPETLQASGPGQEGFSSCRIHLRISRWRGYALTLKSVSIRTRVLVSWRSSMFVSSSSRLSTLIFVATLAAQAWAQDAAEPEVMSLPVEETFIPGDSVEALPMAAWYADDGKGLQLNTASGRMAVTCAPASASKYTRKAFVFPTGSIYQLVFKGSQGGALHPITNETKMYVRSGSVTVGLDADTVAISEGDFVSHPSGVIEGRSDAEIILWDAVGTIPRVEAKPMVVRAADAPVSMLAYWYHEDGSRTIVTTPEEIAKAPANALRLDMKGYAFDDNSGVVTQSYKGGPTNKSRGERDALLFVLKGKVNFFQDDIDIIAEPGDAIREAGGHYHNWIRLMDSSFVAVSTTAQPLATK